MKKQFGLPARQHAFGLSRRVASRALLLDDDDDPADDLRSGAYRLDSKTSADYIETMSLQLHTLAVSSDLTFLSYLLRLVAEEARLAGDQTDW